MNTSTFAGDLMSEMLPLIELERLSTNPRYRQAFARELLNPNRIQEAFEVATILDRPEILERLITTYGYPGGFDPDILDYDENAPVQSDDLVADIFRNRSPKTFAYLYNRFKDVIPGAMDATIAIALTTIYNEVRDGQLPIQVLLEDLDILLNTDPNATWQVKELGEFAERRGDTALFNALKDYQAGLIR